MSLALDPHPVPDSPAHTESLDLSYLTPERLKASEYGDVRLDKPEAGDRLEEHSPKHDMPKPSILGDLTNLPKGGAKSFFSKRPGGFLLIGKSLGDFIGRICWGGKSEWNYYGLISDLIFILFEFFQMLD